MSAIKRSDVKNHLHPPFLANIHLVRPASQTDATGFFAVEPDTVETDPPDFADDFVTEHSSFGGAVKPADQEKVSIGSPALPALKSAKA